MQQDYHQLRGFPKDHEPATLGVLYGSAWNPNKLPGGRGLPGGQGSARWINPV